METHIKPIEILLVEDNEGDVRLTVEALKDSKVLNNIHRVSDGDEALDFLHRKGRYNDAVSPDLILLDLNLPRKNGIEVLSEIKGDEKLKKIPVVVLTISSNDMDIIKTYNLHVNCFITKPIDFERFVQVVHSIEEFWLTVVKLPPKNGTNPGQL
jgi:two-component system, chemotaxis family, response regulator Rcp1